MERAVGVLGIAALVGIGYLASVDRRAIDWRSFAVAMGLQLAIAAVALQTAAGGAAFAALNDAAVAFINAANAGIDFVFGVWPAEVWAPETAAPPAGLKVVHLPFVFAVRVLPVIIFMSSVFAVLYHWGLLQRVVEWMARGLRWALPVSGAEALSTAANVFLGMVESPLIVRPYVPDMTRSELFCVMVGGLASIAGSVLVAYAGMLGPEYAGHLVTASIMSAPAAIAFSKLIVPERGQPRTAGDATRVSLPSTHANVIDAAAAGASEGLQLALNVGAMLIAFVAIIFLLDSLLGRVGLWFGYPGVDAAGVPGRPLSFGQLLGTALGPLAWLLGVPWKDALPVGQLLGVKTVLNEFIAYDQLAGLRAALDPRSIVIATYALCGFANFGSLAILLGGLGGMVPSRRGELAADGLRAILAGSLASFSTGAIAGLLL